MKNMKKILVDQKLIYLFYQAYAWGFDIRSWQCNLSPLTWPEVLRQFALAAGFGPKLKKRNVEQGFSREENEVRLHCKKHILSISMSCLLSYSFLNDFQINASSRFFGCVWLVFLHFFIPHLHGTIFFPPITWTLQYQIPVLSFSAFLNLWAQSGALERNGGSTALLFASHFTILKLM